MGRCVIYSHVKGKDYKRVSPSLWERREGREGGGGRGAEADRRACQTVRGFLWVVVMSPVFTFFIPFIYIF